MDDVRELGAARAAVLDAVRDEDRARSALRRAETADTRERRQDGVVRQPCGGGWRVIRSRRVIRFA